MPNTIQHQLLEPRYLDRSKAENLIECHQELVKRVVRGFLKNKSTSLGETELIGAALMGLIDAINRFNPQKGDHFESYARIRIRGAILDRVRQEDNLTRSKRNFVNQLERAIKKLEGSLHQPPGSAEIAAEMDMPLDKFEHMLAEITQPTVDFENLEESQIEEGLVTGGKISDVFDFEDRDPMLRLLHIENNQIIEKALQNLSPKQRLCVRLSFYEDMPLTRIAELLRVSVSRVSQIRTEALSLIKQQMRQYQ